MIKMVMPMKRRPGMTIPEFREYYETKHRIIGEKYLKGYATKYMRRFTNSIAMASCETRNTTCSWKSGTRIRRPWRPVASD